MLKPRLMRTVRLRDRDWRQCSDSSPCYACRGGCGAAGNLFGLPWVTTRMGRSMRTETNVANYYTRERLEESILQALTRAGKDSANLTHGDLAALDEFQN